MLVPVEKCLSVEVSMHQRAWQLVTTTHGGYAPNGVRRAHLEPRLYLLSTRYSPHIPLLIRPIVHNCKYRIAPPNSNQFLVAAPLRGRVDISISTLSSCKVLRKAVRPTLYVCVVVVVVISKPVCISPVAPHFLSSWAGVRAGGSH